MSHTYHLLCRECRHVLDLGKIVDLDENDKSVSWSLAGWRDLATGVRVEEVNLLRTIERFLIVHRNHPLQVVSEAYLHVADAEGVWKRFDTFDEVMELKPDPEPDDYRDADEVQRREREPR